MVDNARLEEAIREVSEETDGRRTLSCSEAFRLSGRLGCDLPEIKSFCDSADIRITKCQLGCF